MGSKVTPHEVKGHPMGSDITLWALWGPISSNGIYRVERGSMGSKPILWGQRSPNGVKGHPMGSEVTLWGVRSHPMGSMASKITLWDL